MEKTNRIEQCAGRLAEMAAVAGAAETVAGAAVEDEPLLKPVESTRAERWGVAASAVIAYVYVLAVFSEGQWQQWMMGFAALLCAGTGLALRGVPRRRECWVWLGCLWTALLCGALGRARAWSDMSWLILHGFGAYWLIARGGRLLADGGSSRYFPADVFHGAVTVPFRHFFLRLRVLRSMGLRGGRRRLGAAAVVGVASAVITALFLLGLSMTLLAEADPNFRRLTDGLWRVLSLMDAKLWIDFLLSLPVGAYLYGMVFGAQREELEQVRARRGRISEGVRLTRRVPGAVWPALMGLFVALYAAFFAVQGSYLFDGLRGLLPEAFTAAEYARRGFFELCGVMAINFTLLGTASLSGEGGLRAHPAARGLSAALLGESGLLAVTAAAKLALYIRRFGLTPLRLQSCWLVAVLFAGCLAALRSLFTGRDTTKAWLLFAGVTLALTHLW